VASILAHECVGSKALDSSLLGSVGLDHPSKNCLIISNGSVLVRTNTRDLGRLLRPRRIPPTRGGEPGGVTSFLVLADQRQLHLPINNNYS